jgi:hypothetical protein
VVVEVISVVEQVVQYRAQLAGMQEGGAMVVLDPEPEPEPEPELVLLGRDDAVEHNASPRSPTSDFTDDEDQFDEDYLHGLGAGEGGVGYDLLGGPAPVSPRDACRVSCWYGMMLCGVMLPLALGLASVSSLLVGGALFIVGAICFDGDAAHEARVPSKSDWRTRPHTVEERRVMNSAIRQYNEEQREFPKCFGVCGHCDRTELQNDSKHLGTREDECLLIAVMVSPVLYISVLHIGDIALMLLPDYAARDDDAGWHGSGSGAYYVTDDIGIVILEYYYGLVVVMLVAIPIYAMVYDELSKIVLPVLSVHAGPGYVWLRSQRWMWILPPGLHVVGWVSLVSSGDDGCLSGLGTFAHICNAVGIASMLGCAISLDLDPFINDIKPTGRFDATWRSRPYSTTERRDESRRLQEPVWAMATIRGKRYDLGISVAFFGFASIVSVSMPVVAGFGCSSHLPTVVPLLWEVLILLAWLHAWAIARKYSESGHVQGLQQHVSEQEQEQSEVAA